MIALLLFLLLSSVECNDDFSGEYEGIEKYTSALKQPISTPEDIFTLHTGKDVVQKLVRLLTDAEFREGRNEALKTVSPKTDPLVERELRGDDILDDLLTVPKVHIHHIFPPKLIRPLQKAIIRKMIKYIKKDPVKILKKKVKRIASASTVVLGLGFGVKELKELKSPVAVYRVTGLEDLSAKKKKYENYEMEDRSDDGLVEDLYDPDYKAVKDYKLVVDKSTPKHDWPFHENKEEIYEKWNKFPAPENHSPFHHKVKHLHRSFHEIQPDLLHIVKDVHGLVGHKTKVIHSGPELEHPIVLAGQLLKLVDSLIPSIRIRIPFVEYLVKSFYQKSKPKVVYVKQPPKVKYVGVPYKEEMAIPEGMHKPEPLEVKLVGGNQYESSEPNYRRYSNVNQNAPEYQKPHYQYSTGEQVHNQWTSSQTNSEEIDSEYIPKPEPQIRKYTEVFDQARKIYSD